MSDTPDTPDPARGAQPGSGRPEPMGPPPWERASDPGYAGGVPQYPTQPVAPNPYASKPRRRRSRGAVIGIIAGAAVFLLVVVTAAGIGISNAVRAAQTTPASVVEEYLGALQRGDAKQALSHLDTPYDTSLLTDDVVRASNKISKISKISTTSKPDGSMFTEVTATFSIGSERVTQEFTVSKEYQGGYSIISGGTISVAAVNLGSGPLTLNGQEVSGDTWLLFPGAYSLELDRDDFAVTGGDEIIVAGDGFDALDGVEIALNETGVQEFRKAVTDAVNACTASTNLVAGCGLDLPGTLSDGTVVQDGTITRTLSADAQANLANLEPQKTYTDPLRVYGDYIGSVTATSTACTQNGATGGCDILFGPSLGSPQVDFTSGTPVVRWD